MIRVRQTKQTPAGRLFCFSLMGFERVGSECPAGGRSEPTLTEPAGESESLPLRQKTRLSRSKSRKDFLAAFVFENMEGGTYELFKL